MDMLLRVAVLLFSATLGYAADCQNPESQRYGRVQVTGFASDGEQVSPIGIDLVEAGSRRSFNSHFKAGIAKKIPYGVYELRVTAPGFHTVRQEIRIFQPLNYVRLRLAVGAPCGRSYQLQGTVRPAPGSRALWIKLIPTIGSGGREIKVAPDGKFFLDESDSGTYLLLALEGEKILQTQTVTMPNRDLITVNLPAQ